MNRNILLKLTLFTQLACLTSACGLTPVLPPPPAIMSKTDADVTARRESLSFTRAALGPDGSLLYSYQREQEVELRDYDSKSARRSLSGGLWVKKPGQEPREILAGDYISGISQFAWLDAQRVVWIEPYSKEVTALDVASSTRQVLYRGEGISYLSAYGNRIYFIEREGSGSQYRLVSLAVNGEVKKLNLPRGVYYAPNALRVMDENTAVVTMAKPSPDAGNYRIATSMIPPMMDSYLFNLNTGSSEKIPAALDLNGIQNVTLSPDNAHVLLQTSGQGVVYDFTGPESFNFSGQGKWLENNQLLVLNEQGLSRYNSEGQKVFDLARAGCPGLFGSEAGMSALVNCQTADQAQLYRYTNDALELLHQIKPASPNFVFNPREGWG